MPAVLRARFRAFALLFFALVLVCLSQTPGLAEVLRTTTLTILYTNDVHGHLFPFDFDELGEKETDVGGAARRASLIRRLKAEAKGPVLVMDAGDVFERGPLGDLHGAPDFDVMNAVPYDVMTLGNNEFRGAPGSEGQRIIFDRIKQAKFAVVCANVCDAAAGKMLVPAYKLFELSGVKIGVLGLTAPRVATYSQAKGLEVRDPIATAKAVVSELEKQSDFVVALTHIGYPADLELAMCVPGIDVVIGGDSHTWLSQPTPAGALICQDGKWGKCVGKLKLSLRLSGEHRYKVSGYSNELVEVDSSIQPAPDVAEILQRYVKPYMRRLCTLKTAVASSQAPAWVAQRLREAAHAQVGVEPVEAIENGLKAGAVTELDVRRIFPFLNPVLKLSVTGKQLRGYVLGTNAGLAGAQVRNGILHVGGSRVADSKTYTLAIEEFYARTSPALAGAKFEELHITSRDVVKMYLAAIANSD